MGKVRVIIADGSGYVRLVMSDILNAETDIEVIDTAVDCDELLQKVTQLQPDVVIMDVDLPKVEKLSAVKPLLQQHNISLIVTGSQEQVNPATLVSAIRNAANDIIVKPEGYLLPQLRNIAEELVQKVKKASWRSLPDLMPDKLEEPEIFSSVKSIRQRNQATAKIKVPSHLVVIGASTGGAPAIECILKKLPPDFSAAILIAQHMPPGFSSTFTRRLNSICNLKVEEAHAGLRLEAGKIIVATPEANLVVRTIMGSRTNLSVEFSYDEYSLYDRPSIDLLMQSCASVYEDRTIGIILSGLGKDGSIGLRAIREKGGYTIAQDQTSSVIFGMAKAAIEEGSIDKVLPLSEISGNLISYIKQSEIVL